MGHGNAKVVASLLVLVGGLAVKAAEMPKVEQHFPPHTDRYGDPLPPGAIARLGTIRWRHGDRVAAIAYSPDGKTLASAAHDKLVRFWDAKTGRLLRTFRGHEAEANCVLFTPDGSRLITQGCDNTTRLWSVATGKELHRWNVRGGWKIALSPDGKTLAGFAAAQPKATLYLRDLATGVISREMPYEGKDDSLLTLAFSPNGKTLLTGGQELRRWDVATGKQLEVFGEGRGRIHAIAFSPDGKFFAVGSEKAATLWDAATQKVIRKLPEHPVDSVAISADGKRLATGGDTVRIWDIARGKKFCECKGRHQGRIRCVAFSPDDRTIAGGSDGSSIQIWDAATGEERTHSAGHESWLRFTRFTPDGKSILTGSWDSWVRRWDISTMKETLSFRASDNSFGLTFALAPDGRTLAAGNGKAIQLLDAATGKLLRRFAAFSVGSMTDLAFSPRGDRIAFGLRGGTAVHIWDAKSGKELRAIHTPPHCMAFSPDGKILATNGGEGDRALCLRNADTGKLIRRWAVHRPPIEAGAPVVAAFFPDGRLLASAGADRTVRIWDAATGQQLVRLQPDRPFLCRCLAVAPDGKTLATSGWDRKTIRLWETASGRERSCFDGHSGGVISFAYSVDGRFLVSGGSDTSALVWAVWPPASAERTTRSPREMDRLWDDLADADAARAWRAMAALYNNPRSTPVLLKEKLPAIVRPHEKKIVQLIAELDSDQFTVRSNAERELEKMEELAEPALRRAWMQKPSSLEQRRRLEALVQRLEARILSAETLRQLRAVEVLEHIDSPQAREVLRTLVEGTPEARLTHEAKAALARLTHRSNTAP